MHRGPDLHEAANVRVLALRVLRADFVLQMDADLQHSPDLLPLFLELAERGCGAVPAAPLLGPLGRGARPGAGTHRPSGTIPGRDDPPGSAVAPRLVERVDPVPAWSAAAPAVAS